MSLDGLASVRRVQLGRCAAGPHDVRVAVGVRSGQGVVRSPPADGARAADERDRAGGDAAAGRAGCEGERAGIQRHAPCRVTTGSDSHCYRTGRLISLPSAITHTSHTNPEPGAASPNLQPSGRPQPSPRTASNQIFPSRIRFSLHLSPRRHDSILATWPQS